MVIHACHSSCEAEVRRITGPGQPLEKSSQDPILTEEAGCGGAHLSSQQWWEGKIGRSKFEASGAKIETLCSKEPEQKQLVE
jgi:hypothetical protein